MIKMVEIELKKGEAKTLTFTIKNRKTGEVIDVSSATQTFIVKSSKTDVSGIIEKTDSDFTKTNASNGIVSVTLSTTDTDMTAGTYIAELKTHFSGYMSDKSADIDFIIVESVN